MARSSIFKNLSVAVNEKDVENAWRAYLAGVYKDGSFTSPYKCDGYLVRDEARILCEFKHDCDFNIEVEKFQVIAQSVCYIHKFIEEGVEPPNLLFIGDKNECFVVSATVLIPYARGNYDWTIAPSSAGKNLQLMSDLMKDSNIYPMKFDVNDDFKWETVHFYFSRQIRQSKAELPITAKTLPNVFEYWMKNVIKEKEIDENRMIEVFYKVLTSPQDCYPHPKKDGTLIVGDSEVKINKRSYGGFFSLYKETHNPVELRELTANKDRLITEMKRRRTGAFFTPADWVNEAHKMLSEHLGENWRDEYVVWDCSCGTANLTRDFGFKELYLSTLEDTDINIIREAGYNSGACVFKMDFLNDGLDILPEGLRKALESCKKVVFLNNPPYGTFANMDMDGTNKAGITETVVNKMMNDDNMGNACKQLYTQFMYRIMKIVDQYKLKDSVMATFTDAKIMSGSYYENFRGMLTNNVSFIDGMMFQASHFADVADSWSIAFTIFKA
jgi:hypothetical protein